MNRLQELRCSWGQRAYIGMVPRGMIMSIAMRTQLTEKQARFIRFMIETDGDQIKSAELAGYSKRSARTQAYRAMQNDSVRSALDLARATGQQRALDEAAASEEWICSKLISLVNDDSVAVRDRVSCLSLLSKRIPAFRDPSVLVQHNQSVMLPPNVTLQDLRSLATDLRERLPEPSDDDDSL